MLTFDDAMSKLRGLEVGARAQRIEEVPLSLAHGRFLAKDIAIDRDQPGFDRATMDGFAVVPRGEALSFSLRGVVTAGQQFEGKLGPGEAVRIMTGAPAPAGTTVVPIEATSFEDGQEDVTLMGVPEAGKNIAWQGEDAHRGDVLVAAGTRLAPVHLSVAAMAGATSAEVYQAPRVSIVTTGDEVGAQGAAGIRDSNGPLLDGLLGSLGAAIDRRHARDDEGELAALLEAAASSADITVTTGGVSMGTHDLVPRMLHSLGFETLFHRVQVQPGKPILVAARDDGALFIGLPGNPVSVLATAHLFLMPALGHFLGGWAPRWVSLPMAEAFEHRGKRHLFLPAELSGGGLRPVNWNGSGDLIAAGAADGLIELPVGATFAAGSSARFLPYVGHALAERSLLPPRA